MKKIIFLVVYLLSFLGISLSFAADGEWKVNDDLEVRKLSDHVYAYTSWSMIGKWGRVGSNGLIVVNKGQAFLIDTPMEEAQTAELIKWAGKELKVRFTGFVPGHWHDDCVGGLAYLNKTGVETYAHKMTNDLLKQKGKAVAKHSFEGEKTLKLGDMDIQCRFLGGGHAIDNIVVWLPGEKILFGGCMLKDCKTDGLGNTSDASPLPEWLATVKKVAAQYPEAKVVVPGHGDIGGREILEHTQKVLQSHLDKQDSTPSAE